MIRLLPVATGLLVLALGYLAATYRGESSVALWWPAAGVAVAAYALAWRHGGRIAVLVAIALGVLCAELLADYSLAVSLAFAVANLANPVVCVGLLSRLVPTLRLRDAGDYARFCVAAFLGALVTAASAAVTLRVLEDGDPWAVMGAVVPSHLSAVLVIATVVLLVPRRPAPASRVETSLQVGLTLLVTLYVFSPWQPMPLGFLCIGFLIWGAVRIGATWLSVQVVLIAVVATVAASQGWGGYPRIVSAYDLPAETLATLVDVMLLGIALAVWPLSLASDVHRSSLAEVRESRELLDSVLTGATGTAIVGAELDGVVSSWNAGAERMLGWSERAVRGRRTLGELRDGPRTAPAGPGLDPRTSALVAPLLRGADWVDEDWQCVRQDGGVITVAFRLTARRSADGEVIGWIAVGEDVTERRRTERALHDALERERQAVHRLEDLDAVKTSFVQSASHELRTPLTSVLGYTDMLLGEQLGELNPQQRKMLTSVARNGRRLLTLVEDLLTLSSIEQGRFTAVAERVDLREPVRRALEAVAAQAEAASVGLEVDLGRGRVPVIGDPDQLERVTTNLLANAVKFTPADGVVGLSVHGESGEAVLTVTDTGTGIPAGELARLFERFYRSSTAQRAEVQGSGLGLAIVKEVVDRHDGRVEVESEEGAGTTVRVRLPLQAPASATATPAAPAVASPAVAAPAQAPLAASRPS